MNTKQSLTVATILGLCITLGLLLTRPTVGQPAPAQQSGRYHIELKPHTGASNTTTVFVVDTQTGQCWYRDTNTVTKEWTDMGSPAR